MGINGNERADSAAKAELQEGVSECLISYTDAYQYIGQCVSVYRSMRISISVNAYQYIGQCVSD